MLPGFGGIGLPKHTHLPRVSGFFYEDGKVIPFPVYGYDVGLFAVRPIEGERESFRIFAAIGIYTVGDAVPIGIGWFLVVLPHGDDTARRSQKTQAGVGVIPAVPASAFKTFAVQQVSPFSSCRRVEIHVSGICENRRYEQAVSQ